MEIHRQTCQLCGCHTMRNILVREPGEPEKVFAQCAKCKELVARYVIKGGGYYHAHRGFESYLRSIVRVGETMSGGNIKKDYDDMEGIVSTRWEKIKQLLAEQHKDD